MKNAAKMLLFMLILTAAVFSSYYYKGTLRDDPNFSKIAFLGIAVGVLVEAALLLSQNTGLSLGIWGAVGGSIFSGEHAKWGYAFIIAVILVFANIILSENVSQFSWEMVAGFAIIVSALIALLGNKALPDLNEYALLAYTVLFWFVCIFYLPTAEPIDNNLCMPFLILIAVAGTAYVLALCFTNFRPGNITTYLSSIWLFFLLLVLGYFQLYSMRGGALSDSSISPFISFPTGLITGMIYLRCAFYYWALILGFVGKFARREVTLGDLQISQMHTLLIIFGMGGVLFANHLLGLIPDFLLAGVAFLGISHLTAMRAREAIPAPTTTEPAKPVEEVNAEREAAREKAISEFAARMEKKREAAASPEKQELRDKITLFKIILVAGFLLVAVFGCAMFYGVLIFFGSHGSHQNETAVNESEALAQVEQQLQVPERNYSYSISFMAAQSESMDPVEPQFLERSNVTEERNKTILWKFEPPLLAAAKKAGSASSVARINMSGSNIVIGLHDEDSAVVAKEISHKVLYGGYGAEGCKAPAWVAPEMDSGNSIEIDGKKYYFGDGMISGDGSRKGVMLYDEEGEKYDIWKDSATNIHGESIILWTRVLENSRCLSWIEISIVDNPVVAGEETGGIETIVSEEGGINYTRLVSVSLPRGYFGDRP